MTLDDFWKKPKHNPTCSACCLGLEGVTAPDNGLHPSPAELRTDLPTRLLGDETLMGRTVSNSRVID